MQLWVASQAGAVDEVEQLLAEAAARGEATLVDLGTGEVFWGWHPILARFTVGRRAPEAPAHLPAYLARLADAGHVHAGGTSPENAVAELVELFVRVARHIDPPHR